MNWIILKTNRQKLSDFLRIKVRSGYSESDRIRIHNTGYWQEYNIRLGSGFWAEKWTCQGGGTPSAPTWSRSTLNSSMRRWNKPPSFLHKIINRHEDDARCVNLRMDFVVQCKYSKHFPTEIVFPTTSRLLAVFWFYRRFHVISTLLLIILAFLRIVLWMSICKICCEVWQVRQQTINLDF